MPAPIPGTIINPNGTIYDPEAAALETSLNKIQSEQYAATPGINNNPPALPPQTSALNISTGNPALKTLFDSTNRLLADYQQKGGVVTPEIQKHIQAINDAEIQKQGAVSSARSAADNKDASALDTHIVTANAAESAQQSSIRSLLDELKIARQNYITNLTPTQAETDLQTKLNTLRTERQLLPLELRNEGISVAGINARQVNDERVRAIQEQNLLLEIGLKQDARKMAAQEYKDQIGFIGDDITLQQQIQDRLDKQEQQTLENARNLSKDSLSALSTIVDSFKGLAWNDLDPQTQSDISNVIKKYPDLTPGIVSDALKIAKQQEIFNRATKKGGNWSEPYLLGGDYVQKNDLTGEIRMVVNIGTSVPAGQLSKQQYERLNAVGIGQELANQLTTAILQNIPLDKIREALRRDGIDSAVLDHYDNVVGIATLLKNAKTMGGEFS